MATPPLLWTPSDAQIANATITDFARAVGKSGSYAELQAWSASSLDPTRFNITAEFGDAQISGTAAVNLYGGPYTASDGNFSVGDLYITQMAGSEAAMRAEAIYMDLLGQARHYEVTGTTLTLRNASHQTTLVFRSTGQKIPKF